MNAIELQEKNRIKRQHSLERPKYLPVLDTTFVPSQPFIRRNEKIFEYLGKEIHYIGFDAPLYFPMIWLDLITPQDLLDLQDNDFSAFGVGLPKRIILEVLDFHQKSNDDFSKLVKKYPFAQMIFTQWLTIKLYEKHKELIHNPKLEYSDFMQAHFSLTFSNKPYTIYQAIQRMQMQELNNIGNKDYSIASFLTALTEYNNITLYDIIYDIIPNSIRKQFLKDEESLKAYLPLKQEKFEYKEKAFNKEEKMFSLIYGDDATFIEGKIPKQWYAMEALNLKNYLINDKELIVPKAKINKLGIGYDELLEFINNDETSLDYPDIWEFDKEDATIEVDGEYFDGYKNIKSNKIKSSWKNIIQMRQSFAPYADSYLSLYSAEVWDRGTVYVSDDEIIEIASSQYFQSIALIVQNNFRTEYTIFESLRQKMRNDSEFRVDSVWLNTRYGCATSCFEASQCTINAYLAYRFNQALALSFLNAYDKENNGI